MLCHRLVTRNEFVRCLEGVPAEDGVRRIMPMNSISWIVGHLANQEHGWWVYMAQGRMLAPGLNDLVGFGQPAATPPLDEMWAAWRTATQAADEYLETLTTEVLQTHLVHKGVARPESVGTMVQRNIASYLYRVTRASTG